MTKIRTIKCPTCGQQMFVESPEARALEALSAAEATIAADMLELDEYHEEIWKPLREYAKILSEESA